MHVYITRTQQKLDLMRACKERITSCIGTDMLIWEKCIWSTHLQWQVASNYSILYHLVNFDFGTNRCLTLNAAFLGIVTKSLTCITIPLNAVHQDSGRRKTHLCMKPGGYPWIHIVYYLIIIKIGFYSFSRKIVHSQRMTNRQ